jgi:hypothetical protein
MTKLAQTWEAARRPESAALAVPVLTVLAFGLVVGVMFVVDAVRQTTQESWHPHSRALTVEDFAPHRAEEIPVERSWLGLPGLSWDESLRQPTPQEMPVLRYLSSNTSETVVDVGMLDGMAATSGVRVDGVEVYTSMHASHRGPRTAPDVVADLSAQTLGRDTGPNPAAKAAEHGRVLDDVRPIGDVDLDWYVDPPWEQYGEHDAAAGERGYVGYTALEVDPESGAERRLTAVATVVDGALVLVGTDAPADAPPAPATDVATLLDRVAAKLAAVPPSDPAEPW